MGCCFLFGTKKENRTHSMQVPGGHLPFGSWMPNAPYDLPPGQIGHRFPYPAPKSTAPSGVLFLRSGKRKRLVNTHSSRSQGPSSINCGIAATGSYRKLDSLRDAPPPPTAAVPLPLRGRLGGRLGGRPISLSGKMQPFVL